LAGLVEDWRDSPALRAVHALDASLPPASPIIADAGAAHRAVAIAVASRGQRPVLMTNGLTTMGWSLGAALGASVALPEQPVGVVIGDGSLVADLGDVAALVRHRVPAVIVVLANGVHSGGWLRLAAGDRERILRLPDVDWPAVLGALGVGVHADVEQALVAAHAGPQAVIVPTPEHDGVLHAVPTGVAEADATTELAVG
jgi:thiamine pyrophosphate-dependent acetolactate synthase large subunit-like protein